MRHGRAGMPGTHRAGRPSVIGREAEATGMPMDVN
jgi:hypothetical protein